jgi:hypothetical protein
MSVRGRFGWTIEIINYGFDIDFILQRVMFLIELDGLNVFIVV